MKQILGVKCQQQDNQEEIQQHVEKVVKQATSKLSTTSPSLQLTLIPSSTFSELKIAGNSTEYVNSVLEKYKSGNAASALEEV